MPPGRDSSDGAGEVLHTGCVPELALQRLQSLVGALYAFDPNLELKVMRLRTARQLERLAAGELDLGIVHGTPTGPEIEVEPLFRGEPVTAILPVGHPLAGRPSIASDLGGEILLTFPRAADPALYDHLTNLISGAGLRFGGVRAYGEQDPRLESRAARGCGTCDRRGPGGGARAARVELSRLSRRRARPTAGRAMSGTSRAALS